MEEEWKDLPGWESCYRISNFGNLYSYHHKKLLMVNTNQQGYRTKTLYDGKNGKRKIMMVHRLVLMTFQSNPPDGQPHVNHKDGNKLNNRLDNLEWCSPQENMDHADRTGLLINQRRSIRDRSANSEFHLRVNGDDQPKCKWSDELKIEIREKYAAGISLTKLQIEYPEIPKCTLWSFLSGRRK